MDKQKVKELALANGFKLKPQPDGSEDLNPYVYEFAAALAEEAIRGLRFPTALRCMWSGGDVKRWLEEQADRYSNKLQQQLDTGMIVGSNTDLAVCLAGEWSGWLFRRHPDGQWVSTRLALPIEIERAKYRKEQIEIILGIPQRG